MEGGREGSGVEVVRERDSKFLRTPRYKQCLADSIYLGMLSKREDATFLGSGYLDVRKA
jgi:hypothetical protein